MPDVNKFPDPHQFGTYMTWRNPAFKTHGSLAVAKNAISGKSRGYKGDRVLGCDAYVYEWSPDEGRWVELHFIPKDTPLDDHPFYKTKAKKGSALAASEAAIEAAIQSITGS